MHYITVPVTFEHNYPYKLHTYETIPLTVL